MCFWWATAARFTHAYVCDGSRVHLRDTAADNGLWRVALIVIILHIWPDRRILRRSKRPGYRSALLKQPFNCSSQSSCLSTIWHLNKVTFDTRVPPQTVQESAQRSLWLHYQWARKQLSSGSFDLRIPVVISSGFETDGQVLPQHVPSEACQLALKHERRRQMFDSETQITHFWFEGCKL